MSYDILDAIIQNPSSRTYKNDNITIMIEYRRNHTFRIIHRVSPLEYEFLFINLIFDDDYIIIDRNFHTGYFRYDSFDLISIPRSNKKDELVEFILSNGRIFSDDWFLSEPKLKGILSKDDIIKIIKNE